MPITTPVVINTRASLARQFTHAELDANFTNLKAAADAVGNRIVTTWAALMSMSTVGVTAYVDRFFVTDVGVGGSEWYWDGSRYRVVGGQVVLFSLSAQTEITGASTLDTTMLIDSPTTTCKIPAGLIKTGDRIYIESYISKPNIVATVGASTNIRYRFGSTGSSTDPAIASTSAMSASIRTLSDMKSLLWVSDTSIRRISDFSLGLGTSTTVDTAYNGTSSVLNNTNYITVTAGLTGGTTPANDTLQLLSFAVTLKTL